MSINVLVKWQKKWMSILSKNVKRCLITASQMWGFAACNSITYVTEDLLILECWLGKKWQHEDITFGSGNLWWAFFTIIIAALLAVHFWKVWKKILVLWHWLFLSVFIQDDYFLSHLLAYYIASGHAYNHKVFATNDSHHVSKSQFITEISHITWTVKSCLALTIISRCCCSENNLFSVSFAG